MNNHPVSPENNKPFKHVEDCLVASRRRAFYRALKEEFSTAKIDTQSKAFTRLVANHVLKRVYDDLSADEKMSWQKRINRLVIDKFGGHAEAGWKLEQIFENAKKKEEQKRQAAQQMEGGEFDEADETVDNFLASFELRDFSSD